MTMSFHKRKKKERRLSDGDGKVPRPLRVSLILIHERFHHLISFLIEIERSQVSFKRKKKKEHLEVHKLII
jgi:hypothetical protein